jgi:CRISPR system Cascade subunit CasE
MYLSRLTLNPRSGYARRDLADVYQLHRTIMSAFAPTAAGAARSSLGVLFRVEPEAPLPVVLVQSQQEPRWELPQGYLAPGTNAQSKPIAELLDAIAAGRTYRFRLLANPTRKIARFHETSARMRQGSRVDLRRDADRLEWIKRKGNQHGFQLAQLASGQADAVDVLVRSVPRQIGRKDETRITVAGALFDGLLVVDDADGVRNAVVNGVGPGKAFGFGLLSLGPDR